MKENEIDIEKDRLFRKKLIIRIAFTLVALLIITLISVKELKEDYDYQKNYVLMIFSSLFLLFYMIIIVIFTILSFHLLICIVHLFSKEGIYKYILPLLGIQYTSLFTVINLILLIAAIKDNFDGFYLKDILMLLAFSILGSLIFVTDLQFLLYFRRKRHLSMGTKIKLNKVVAKEIYDRQE